MSDIPKPPMNEPFADKVWRKTRDQPLVPLGALLTTGFLLSGFSAFRRGDKQRSQLLMRGRVAAQAFTVIAMGVGAYLGMKPHNRPENMEQKMENMAKSDADEVAAGIKK
mmetsp:Transcript_36041/g.71723  ORF Transcript_36041/g.71723 Transcript_36041/m.71723 type:complete len:110 (-) Transcript_36041:118-447(-)